MITNEQLQSMIDKCRSDEALLDNILNRISGEEDRSSVVSIINEGWYEEFDAYDSAVCEEFIEAYQAEISLSECNRLEKENYETER